MPTQRTMIPPTEVLKPSRPSARHPIAEQLVAALQECVAWMDAVHRETRLSRAIVADAKRILDGAKGGAR